MPLLQSTTYHRVTATLPVSLLAARGPARSDEQTGQSTVQQPAFDDDRLHGLGRYSSGTPKRTTTASYVWYNRQLPDRPPVSPSVPPCGKPMESRSSSQAGALPGCSTAGERRAVSWPAVPGSSLASRAKYFLVETCGVSVSASVNLCSMFIPTF